MYRTQQHDSPRLDTLLDERDTLRIQLSLALDAPSPDEDRIKLLRKAISEAESLIRTHFPRP